MLSVAEEVVNPVNKEWRHVEMVEFPGHPGFSQGNDTNVFEGSLHQALGVQ